MKQDVEYEKRELLIEAAKKEFLEKGYNKASLRSICSAAGVTTGALYFFFENKAQLFAAIVDGPIMGLKKLVAEHFKEDTEYMSKLDSIDDVDMDHTEFSDILMDYIYKYRDSFLLVLCASENTVYENCVDEFVDMLEKIVPPMVSSIKGYSYDEYMSHWMAHITIDAVIHVIKHEKDRDIAGKRMSSIMNYLVQGWVELTMIKEK